jgi:hypothetical protein
LKQEKKKKRRLKKRNMGKKDLELEENIRQSEKKNNALQIDNNDFLFVDGEN